MENSIRKIVLMKELLDLIKDNSNVAILGLGGVDKQAYISFF